MKSVQNTNLSVGLLSAPVKIYAAGSKEAEIRFNYCGPNGEPLEQVYRIKGTEEIVEWDNIGRAYNGHKLKEEDLSNIEAASIVDEDGNSLKHIRIEYFVPLKDVPFERTTDLYYIGPNLKEGNGESLAYLIEGMKKKKVAAIAKVVLRSRQKCFALYVKDGILHAVALRFAETINLREDSELQTDVKLQKPVLDQMVALIDGTTGEANRIDEMADTYVENKRRLVEDLQSGKPVEAVPTAKNVGADLIEQLKGSVEAIKKKDRVTA